MHNEKFMLSDLPDYYIGEEGDLKHYKEVNKQCLFDTLLVATQLTHIYFFYFFKLHS